MLSQKHALIRWKLLASNRGQQEIDELRSLSESQRWGVGEVGSPGRRAERGRRGKEGEGQRIYCTVSIAICHPCL